MSVHQDEIWKLFVIAAAVATSIAAHTIKLPPTWEPAMPYIEFFSGLSAVVIAVSVKPKEQ